MEDTAIHFAPVDLQRHLPLCLAFRKETHLLSYGCLSTFSEEETEQYFQYIAKQEGYDFLHAFQGDSIIGQLEFRTGDGKPSGYINLFFLKEEYRGRGLGKALHDHVIQRLTKSGCSAAELRVIPGNTVAEQFYIRNGWLAVGAPTERGQLMRLSF